MGVGAGGVEFLGEGNDHFEHGGDVGGDGAGGGDFVADAPHDDAGMVAVALDEAGEVFLPDLV